MNLTKNITARQGKEECVQKDFPRKVRLELKNVKTPAVDFLKRNILSLKDTRIQIKFPEQEAGISKGAFSGFPPWEVFLLIISVSANLATIANLIYQILHDRKYGPSSIVFRFDNKRLEISGNFSQHDIEIMLNEFSEIVKSDDEIKLLDNERKKELRDELEHLQEALEKYRRLTEPEGWKKSKDAVDKLKYYRHKRREIERKVSVLKKLLSTNENS